MAFADYPFKTETGLPMKYTVKGGEIFFNRKEKSVTRATDKENVLCGTGEGKIAEILKRAIKEEGYQGFLTLEPHLVLFDALQSLETENAENIIKENKAKDGAEGYSMQYHALIDILDSIEKSN